MALDAYHPPKIMHKHFSMFSLSPISPFPLAGNFPPSSISAAMSTSIFFLWLVSIPLAIQAHPQPQPKGYLLNCGSNKDVEEGPLKYISDDDYVSTGKKATLNRTDILPRLQTLRFFPDTKARKHCYTFPVVKERKYLVRTVYFYGGFDGGIEPPVFDQIIDGTRWSVVNTAEDYANGESSYYEAVVGVAHNKILSVCLARNQHTSEGSSPFISSLEVLFIEDSVYNSTDFQKNLLVTVARSSFGMEKDIISFPDDTFNRYWQPFEDHSQFVTSESHITSSAFWNLPPQKAFSSAITTHTADTLTVNWPPFSLPNSRYYIALYFQDSRTPGPDNWRVFSIHINGQKFYQRLNVTFDGESVVGTEWPLAGRTQISMSALDGSNVAPLINAGEILQILALGGKTVTRDVVALYGMKEHFQNPPEDWAGDPCLPREYSWTGVSCSKEEPFRVLSLNLTGFGLSGSLPHHIAKLTAIRHLWLGDNSLTGEIPDFIELKSLETLHLENNHLEGSIPSSLGELPHLREIFLENNKINGSIPESLQKRHGIHIKLSEVSHKDKVNQRSKF